METLFGLVGQDFVMIASDTQSARSIMVLKSNENRSRLLNAHNVLFYSGEPGDSVNFAEYIQKNVQYYEIMYGIELSTKACASFTRRELAESLRSRNAYSTNLLIGGYSKTVGPSLYWIDYLASSIQVPFACQGYGSYFCYSIMDRYYRSDLTRKEAFQLMLKCIEELKTRFVVQLPKWQIQIIHKDGVEIIEDVLSSTASVAESID